MTVGGVFLLLSFSKKVGCKTRSKTSSRLKNGQPQFLNMPPLVLSRFFILLLFQFAGIHRVYVPKKNNKLIVFFNNRDIVSFIESCCDQSTVIQNEANREAVEKKTAPLKKLNNEYLNISLSFSFPFGFVFNYKIFARTDIATNKMQIHAALKICNTKSNLVFRYSCKLGTCTDIS